MLLVVFWLFLSHFILRSQWRVPACDASPRLPEMQTACCSLRLLPTEAPKDDDADDNVDESDDSDDEVNGGV